MDMSDPRLSVEVRQAFLEIIGQLLVADFQVTTEEDAFFQRLVSRLGLTEAQRDQVVKRVDIGTDAELISAKIPLPLRLELQRVLAEAAAADGEIAPRELDLLERVALVMQILNAYPGYGAAPVGD